MKSRPAPLPLAVLCSAALGLVASPHVASAQAQRIEVQPLANETALTPQDVAVLDSLVLSTLSALPQAQFEVVAGAAAPDPACDEVCRVRAAQGRGAGRAVVGRVAMFGQGFVGSLELYDAATGQLLESATTDAAADPAALLSEMKKAAAQLRRRMAPDEPPPAPAAPAPQPAPAARPLVVAAEAVTATLRVETTPPGADVFVKRLGTANYIGVSPVEKILMPVEYRVIARLKEHESAVREVRLDPLVTRVVRLDLERIYPMSRDKKIGHAFFWPGLVTTGFGFVSMGVARDMAESYRISLGDGYREATRIWTGLMWGGLGLGVALMTTGIVVWAVTPSSKESWEKEHGALAVAPTPDGGLVAAYGRRF